MTIVFGHDEKVLDQFFVETFNRVLYLEEKWLQQEGLEDLTITEIHMIAAIGTRENVPMSSVAKQASLTNGTVTTMVKKLEKKGYVKRRQDAEDKRVVRVVLSEEGRKVKALHDVFHKNMVFDVLRGLDNVQKEGLTEAIGLLNQFFKCLEVEGVGNGN